MQLAAISAGVGADAAPFRGRIHGVFARACTIARGADGLLSLVAAEAGAVPRGFQLALPPGFSFADYVHDDAAVAARGGILRIAGSRLTIDLRSARPWRGLPVAGALAWEDRAVAAAWQAAWRELARRGHAGLPPSARPRIAALVAATRASDDVAATQMAGCLIGLGDGLTPAGDDFLVGFLVALWRVGARGHERAGFLTALSAAVKRAAAATTAISRSYLEAASDGDATERLLVLGDRIARGQAAEAATAARAARSVGATSGAAGTFGFLLGIAAWAPDDLPGCGVVFRQAFG